MPVAQTQTVGEGGEGVRALANSACDLRSLCWALACLAWSRNLLAWSLRALMRACSGDSGLVVISFTSIVYLQQPPLPTDAVGLSRRKAPSATCGAQNPSSGRGPRKTPFALKTPQRGGLWLGLSARRGRAARAAHGALRATCKKS
jgi:hypothetical protein